MSTARIDSEKPREFWVETHEQMKANKNAAGERFWPQVYESQLENTIHVIEYSAYEELNRFIHQGGIGAVITENERLRAALHTIVDKTVSDPAGEAELRARAAIVYTTAYEALSEHHADRNVKSR